jgi:hypothetical protein
MADTDIFCIKIFEDISNVLVMDIGWTDVGSGGIS